jgi:group I intron endonuclease
MKISGIYSIVNNINNKKYIGQSRNIKRRIYNHKYELRKNKHFNKHLQRAWNKYGEEHFSFEVICECSTDEINEKEKYYIELYDSFLNGYNNTEGGEDSETMVEIGHRMAKIAEEVRKSTKNKCLECGNDTKNGYNSCCEKHKYYCPKCKKRKSTYLICNDCKITDIISNCENCGKRIKKNSNRQKYCKKCKMKIRNEQQKILMRKKRASN